MLSQQQGHLTLMITTLLLPICWVHQMLEIHTRSSNNGICPAKSLCFVKRTHSEQYFTTVFNLVTGRAHKLGIGLSCSSLSHRVIIEMHHLCPRRMQLLVSLCEEHVTPGRQHWQGRNWANFPKWSPNSEQREWQHRWHGSIHTVLQQPPGGKTKASCNPRQ